MIRSRALVAPVLLMTALIAAPVAGAETFAAVDSQNRLYRFDDARPGDWKRTTLTGLGSDRLIGIDVRPADRKLYGLSNLKRLYRINLATSKATPVGTVPDELIYAGSNFGFDFDPVADNVRAVTNSGQNLRFDVSTGNVLIDQTLKFAEGDVHIGKAATVVGLAYTNNVAGATSTQLYGIDTTRDKLVRIDSPNDGTLATVGSLKVNVAQIGTSFDISARDGAAYMLANVRDRKPVGLYRVNLATGATRFAGFVKNAPVMEGFAAVSGAVDARRRHR